MNDVRPNLIEDLQQIDRPCRRPPLERDRVAMFRLAYAALDLADFTFELERPVLWILRVRVRRDEQYGYMAGSSRRQSRFQAIRTNLEAPDSVLTLLLDYALTSFDLLVLPLRAPCRSSELIAP